MLLGRGKILLQNLLCSHSPDHHPLRMGVVKLTLTLSEINVANRAIVMDNQICLQTMQ